MPLLAIVLAGVPVASILHRAGRSRWWTVIAFVPPINLIQFVDFVFCVELFVGFGQRLFLGRAVHNAEPLADLGL